MSIKQTPKTSQGGNMNDLEELIKTADALCAKLTKAAQDEKRFSYELCAKLESMSWETWRSANELKDAINFYGVNYVL